MSDIQALGVLKLGVVSDKCIEVAKHVNKCLKDADVVGDHYDCREELLNLATLINKELNKYERFDPETQVAFIWSIEDVKGLRGGSKLTNAQAKEVLDNFEHHHEGSMDAMWYDLEYHLSEWKEEQKQL